MAEKWLTTNERKVKSVTIALGHAEHCFNHYDDIIIGHIALTLMYSLNTAARWQKLLDAKMLLNLCIVRKNRCEQERIKTND